MTLKDKYVLLAGDACWQRAWLIM